LAATREYKAFIARWSRILCAESGLTIPKLAQLFCVSPATFSRWMREHPELAQAVEEGKDRFDTQNVKQALLKRALGYRYKEVTKEPLDKKLVTTKVVTKELPPDPGACKNWLINRDPDKWREKVDVNVNDVTGLVAAIREAHERVATQEKESEPVTEEEGA
jgi:transposase-like protein